MNSPKINESSSKLHWLDEGLRFNAFGPHLRRRFGGRVQRVSLDAGLTCPNVDGTVARGGCNFCDNRSFSPSRRVRLARVAEQMRSGITTVTARYKKVDGFIAYFQPATNTYADVDQLSDLYRLAIDSDPRVVGLAIGTRPDCVPNAVLSLLRELAGETMVTLELGMQTVDDDSLIWMNRAHRHADLVNAVDRARGGGFEICVHVILGVPGETHATAMAAAEEINRLGIDAVKIHNLYAVRGTPLGEEVLAGRVRMPDREDYLRTVADFIQRLPPNVVVERISGDAPPDFLIAPAWCARKSSIRIALDELLAARGKVQGSDWQAPEVDPATRPVPPDETPEAILNKIDARRRLPVLKL